MEKFNVGVSRMTLSDHKKCKTQDEKIEGREKRGAEVWRDSQTSMQDDGENNH
jgi:hypothetical protein